MWTAEQRLEYAMTHIRYDGKPLAMDAWQREFLVSMSRYMCVLKSRQTGFSFAVALKGLVKAMDPARSKYTKQFVSYNEEDAQEKIRYVREFYDSIPAAYRKKLVHSTSSYMEFQDINGKTTSRLISLPCRPPRGRNGDVCLDEFAIYLPRLSNEIYTAASFCVLRKGCIEVGSTPLGTIGKFHEVCTDTAKYGAFDRLNVPWWVSGALCRDVDKAADVAPTMDTAERVNEFGTDRLREIFLNSDLDDFKQECECEFVDSAASYISLDLIWANTPGRGKGDEVKAFHSVEDLILHYQPERDGAPLYAGYYVARNPDAAAIYVVGLHGDKKRSVMNLAIRGDTSFDRQLEAVRKLLSALPVQRLCMDRTGMGEPLFAALRKEAGERVEGVLFTSGTKEAMAMAVKTALERGEYELENERDFHAQIHSIKRVATAGGNFRYDAERNDKGHADTFWAWALASWAADALRRRGRNHTDEWAERHKNDVPAKARSLRDVLSKIEGADLDAIGR